MQTILFFWPILLLPVLVAWLTRPYQQPIVYSKPDVEPATTVNNATPMPPPEPGIFSIAYRKHALGAYQEMLAMAEQDRRSEMPDTARTAQSAHKNMRSLAAVTNATGGADQATMMLNGIARIRVVLPAAD